MKLGEVNAMSKKGKRRVRNGPHVDRYAALAAKAQTEREALMRRTAKQPETPPTDETAPAEEAEVA